eukprot:8712777-Pyramimonas_sp.AAC.1
MKEFPMQVHQFRCDATHQQAIDKEKMHVAMASTIGCSDLNYASEGFSLSLTYTKNACDLQAVHHSTGEETYCLALRELQSISCPTWEERALETLSESPPNM